MKEIPANASGFYVTGGTLPRNAACYISRKADADLLEGLRAGQFCYVLTSRQMGKSSLMVRTAIRLREEGITCVVLDLTAIGQNLDAEHWYGGLLNQLGQQVELEDELDAFWLAPSVMGPMQRWMEALRQVVLRSTFGAITVFVDEIDTVRSLPFSADEFFAGIRQCYNRRSETPEFARLTFCLLGVATPSDLIRDTRTTPFNIGRRIELADFTPQEAEILEIGFRLENDCEQVAYYSSEGMPLLSRILYWTGGHPYLTQRLCQAVAERGLTARSNLRTVDQICRELFLSAGARERDDNLLFVRERLLRSEVDPAVLLDLYRQVRAGKRIVDDETTPMIGLLRLSGIVRGADGFLRVRNRIYTAVFDQRWIVAMMPDAEFQRQKSAYRRGLTRATFLSGVVIAALTLLALTTIQQAQRADKSATLAHRSLYLAGLTAVEGPGVRIILTDSPKLRTPSHVDEHYLVYDRDLSSIVNDLNVSGAEAIAINDQRVVSFTAIRAQGASISVNSIPVNTPFTIQAIGDPVAMKAEVDRQIQAGDSRSKLDPSMVQIDVVRNLHLPAFTGAALMRHARPISNE